MEGPHQGTVEATSPSSHQPGVCVSGVPGHQEYTKCRSVQLRVDVLLLKRRQPCACVAPTQPAHVCVPTAEMSLAPRSNPHWGQGQEANEPAKTAEPIQDPQGKCPVAGAGSLSPTQHFAKTGQKESGCHSLYGQGARSLYREHGKDTSQPHHPLRRLY